MSSILLNKFDNISSKLSDTPNMEGLTVSEIAKLLNIPVQTAARRIERAGIKPITREAVFPFDTPEKIRDANKRGRPAKAKPEDTVKPAKKGKQPKARPNTADN
jgi:hypothetical protein